MNFTSYLEKVDLAPFDAFGNLMEAAKPFEIGKTHRETGEMIFKGQDYDVVENGTFRVCPDPALKSRLHDYQPVMSEPDWMPVAEFHDTLSYWGALTSHSRRVHFMQDRQGRKYPMDHLGYLELTWAFGEKFGAAEANWDFFLDKVCKTDPIFVIRAVNLEERKDAK